MLLYIRILLADEDKVILSDALLGLVLTGHDWRSQISYSRLFHLFEQPFESSKFKNLNPVVIKKYICI